MENLAGLTESERARGRATIFARIRARYAAASPAAIHLHAEGWSLRMIARQLTEDGYAPPRASATAWNAMAVKRLLERKGGRS